MNPKVQQLVFATVAILGFAALAAALFPETSSASAQGVGPVELQAQVKDVCRSNSLVDEHPWTDKVWLPNVVDTDPATTVALLKMNAVVGLKAEVDANNLSFERR